MLIKWRDSQGCEQKFRLINNVSANWKKFGHLLGQNPNLLNAWEVECLKQADLCWCKVMGHWLNEDDPSPYPTTWIGLFTLLKDVECAEVAIRMEAALSSILPPLPPRTPPIPKPSAPSPDPEHSMNSSPSQSNTSIQLDTEALPLSTRLFYKFLEFSVNYCGARF